MLGHFQGDRPECVPKTFVPRIPSYIIYARRPLLGLTIAELLLGLRDPPDLEEASRVFLPDLIMVALAGL